MRLLAARAEAIGDAVALDRVVRLAGAPLDLDSVTLTLTRRRRSRSRALPVGSPPVWPPSLTASGRARLRGRNAALAARTRRKPLAPYKGGSGRYIVRPREGLILLADGSPAEGVCIDPKTFLVVPTGRNAIAASAERGERPAPRDDRLERALDAIIRLANRPSPDVHVHVPVQPIPHVEVHIPELQAPVVNVTVPEPKPTAAVPIRNSLGQIVRVDHIPADD